MCLAEVCIVNISPYRDNLCVCAQSLQLCLTLCDPMDYSLPGSSVHGILQARILEWVVNSSSRGFSRPRDWASISYISCIGRQALLPLVPAGKPNRGNIQVKTPKLKKDLKNFRFLRRFLEEWGWDPNFRNIYPPNKEGQTTQFPLSNHLPFISNPLAAQTIKNPPAVQETQVWSLGQNDPLEKGMATHSIILSRRWKCAPINWINTLALR